VRSRWRGEEARPNRGRRPGPARRGPGDLAPTPRPADEVRCGDHSAGSDGGRPVTASMARPDASPPEHPSAAEAGRAPGLTTSGHVPALPPPSGAGSVEHDPARFPLETTSRYSTYRRRAPTHPRPGDRWRSFRRRREPWPPPSGAAVGTSPGRSGTGVRVLAPAVSGPGADAHTSAPPRPGPSSPAARQRRRRSPSSCGASAPPPGEDPPSAGHRRRPASCAMSTPSTGVNGSFGVSQAQPPRLRNKRARGDPCRP